MEIEHYVKFVLRFLKENKVYYAYLHNAMIFLPIKHKNGDYLDVNPNNYIESFSQYLYKRGNMVSFIDYAFCWEFTREGRNFWEDMHKKFCDEYDREVGK